ncbi:hypothetical protein DdX_20398 [Ditylenchus destructor]|uniref:Uncharacterized protein n=1 Tax=Ditylenchus destructor TaxID=166010 RepID=A0AAD4QW87_9BILA|nr:hypothetical protein DdX_20398 [Ditylenchus destructor]
MRLPPFRNQEDDEAEYCGSRDRDRGGQTQCSTLGDDIDEPNNRQRQRRDPDDVKALRLRIAGFGDGARGDGQRQDRDRGMDEKDPFPAGQRNDRAPDERAEAKADARHHPPGREGAAAVARILELVREERDRADQHCPARQPLKEPPGDQQRHTIGKAAKHGGGAKGRDTDHEDTLAAEAVRKRSGRHQHRGAGERIGVHDPLKALKVAMKGPFQAGQDHRHAGDLQPEHQRAEAGCKQGQHVLAGGMAGHGWHLSHVRAHLPGWCAIWERDNDDGNDFFSGIHYHR